MRPIDPAGGIVQEFAAELRQLREQAGNPPFRQLARRAHYSATTLSVACSGSALPSRDVTLALVRACDGPADYWLQRWHDADATANGSHEPSRPLGLRGDDRPSPRPSARLWRSRLAIAGLMAAAAVASVAIWSVTHPAVTASSQNSSAGTARQALYIGVSPCDIGAVILSQAEVKLPSQLEAGGHDYPAGTVIGEVALRFSRRCALAWTRFLPDNSFGAEAFGSVTLRSYRAADGAASAITMSPVVAAEGDPLLTVPGCVLAQVTIGFGPRQPTATATTGCYP